MTFAAPRVVVVGAINVDLVVAAPRLPGPGETVVGAPVERYGGGKGANAAVAAARAGADVRLVGAVGDDDTGRGALDELRAQGVDVSGVAVLEDQPTGVALIVVDPAGENQIAVAGGANMALGGAAVRRTLCGALSGVGCVLVSTEIPGETVAAAVEESATAGVTCLLNPAPVIPAVLDALDRGPLLTPNAGEIRDLAAALLDDQTLSPDDVTGRARLVMTRTGAPVIVTLGSDGALLIEPDREAQAIPPRPATPRDTTGAGDTFNGVLATRLAAGDALAIAVHVAAAAASLSVAHVGARAGMPDVAAIEAALKAA